MSRIEINQPTPTKPGLYLWSPKLSGHVRLINVYLKPESHQYGISTSGYLAVAESGGRSVTHLLGSFSKQLFLGSDHIKEIE